MTDLTKNESVLGVTLQRPARQRVTDQGHFVARMSPHVKRKSSATRLRGDKQSKAQLLDSIPSWNTHVGSNRHQMPECATELFAGASEDVFAPACWWAVWHRPEKSNDSQRDARQTSTHQQREIYVRQNATRHGLEHLSVGKLLEAIGTRWLDCGAHDGLRPR